VNDYTVESLAKRLRVGREAVRRWIRDGRLFAEKRGNKLYIPATDANLFIKIYEETRRRGVPFEISTPLNERTQYRPQRSTRATMDQNLPIQLRPTLLAWIDDQRRASEKTITRSAFIRDILEREKKRSDLHKQKLERDERRIRRRNRAAAGGERATQATG
jgi:excisionase family DNA binding protein